MVLVLVDFKFKKTDMTIHLGLFHLAAFIQVAIPTLFSPTTTSISMHNVLERPTACNPVGKDLGELTQPLYSCIPDLYNCVERHGNVDTTDSTAHQVPLHMMVYLHQLTQSLRPLLAASCVLYSLARVTGIAIVCDILFR
jgi:hypothetical protein